MESTEPKVVEVKETRVRDGILEGLCVLSDGGEEWRVPANVAVSVEVHRRDGTREQIPVLRSEVSG